MGQLTRDAQRARYRSTGADTTENSFLNSELSGHILRVMLIDIQGDINARWIEDFWTVLNRPTTNPRDLGTITRLETNYIFGRRDQINI